MPIEIDYEWEKEARLAEIRTEEGFGHAARQQRPTRDREAGVTVTVRPLRSQDWSERAEDI